MNAPTPARFPGAQKRTGVSTPKKPLTTQELDAEIDAQERLGTQIRPGLHANGLRYSDAEILGMFSEEDQDPFWIDQSIVPEGMVYEWKVDEVVGQPKAGYLAMLERAGWQYVQHESHPGRFGKPGDTGPIQRSGLYLMMIEEERKDLRVRYEYLKARNQVRDKESSMGEAPIGTGPRVHPKVAPVISREFQRAADIE